MLTMLEQAEPTTVYQLPAAENHMSRSVTITTDAVSPRMTHQKTRDRGMLAIR